MFSLGATFLTLLSTLRSSHRDHPAKSIIELVERLGDPDVQLEDDLVEAFEAASPEVVASPPLSELNFLAIPSGPGEQALREAAAKAVEADPKDPK